MTDSLALSAAPAEPGLDYAFLRDEGTRIVQRQAGKVWTDYNESDPGVTTLEQLCYALTELSYRAGFPVADLLAEGPGGRIDPRRQALYPARDIFPVNPVTEDDYRRLLIDRVPGVANAWITPFRPAAPPPRGVWGVYDLALYVPGLDPGCDPCDERRVVEAARRVYSAHRNLCEDLRAVYVLGAVPVTVQGDVAVSGALAPDEVMAQLLFRLGNLFAPEPARRPLGELVRAGTPPAEIFDGPLMLYGFVADAELAPKAEAIAVQEVVGVAAGTPGVSGVPRLAVVTGGRTWRGNEAVPVPPRALLRLDTRAPRGAWPLRLLCNGVEVKPDPARVERRLRLLWREHRRPWPLDESYDVWFAMPAGERRDLAGYDSVQNQFPAVYGIGAYGLPSGATALRRAQARQLKGYLLPFEQLMADYFAQLAHVRDLFSTLGPDDPDGRRSYWFQYLDGSVPDVEPLLRPGPGGYHQGLPRIVASQDPWVERRASFLAFLLALYADGVDAGAVAGAGGDACGGADPAQRARALYRARLELARRVVESTRDRFRGFDYLRPPSPANAAGMELRCRLQLGLPAWDRRPLREVLEEAGVELRPRGEGGEPAAAEWSGGEMDAAFEPVSPHPVATLAGAPAGTPRVVAEELLDAGYAPGDLRVGAAPGAPGFSAVARAGSGWRLLGRFPGREDAAEAARGFGAVLAELRRHARQLYVVEHLLLRAGRCRGEGCAFAYDSALTAVFFLPPRLLDDEGYRAFAREVVRANAPAHLAVACCFLGAAQGTGFESLYRAWQQALERGTGLRAASARLREFLERCVPAPAAGPAARRRRSER
ncbi:MAG: hypothetical protein ACJ8GN_26145 [Longimicrobiaceae bacterium]